MPSVLVVCTANICRSPMAEAILKRLVANRPDAGQWHVESAGIWAIKGSQAAVLSQYVMRTMGMDISKHQSQPVTNDLLKRFDIILTMEKHHKDDLGIEFKEHKERIFTIGEMVGSPEDIDDPIGGELSDYQATARELERKLSDGLERIYQLALEHQQGLSGNSTSPLLNNPA